MKKGKLILVLIMLTILCISSISPVFAVEEYEKSKLVTIEEFTDEMTELYGKYGLKFEILDDSNYIPITKSIFESELNEIENGLLTAIKVQNENNQKILKLKQENNSNENITPFLMPIHGVYGSSEAVMHPTGLATVTINYSTSAVYNGNNDEFLSVDSPGLWYKSSSVNLDDIDYNSKEWSIIARNKFIAASASGIVKFEYEIFGAVVKSEHPFTIFKSFAAGDNN